MFQAWQFTSGNPEPDELSLAQAAEFTHQENPPNNTLVWIDIAHPSSDDIEQLDAALGLGEFLSEDLREGRDDAGQGTKLMPYGRMYHMAVRDSSLLEHPQLGHRLVDREIDLVFGRGWLCSVRHSADHSLGPDPDPLPMDEIRHRLVSHCTHERALDEGFIVWAFIDAVTDRYFEISEAIDQRIETAEQSLLDDERSGRTKASDGTANRAPNRVVPGELFQISRPLTQLRRQVIPLREVVGALLRREDPTIGAAALLHLRDVYDHLLGITELIESQRDIVAGLRDVQLTIVSNNMNDSMRTLTAWGAILIVATLVTGVLGMNFRDQPNISWRMGFLVVLAVITIVAVPMWWFFRRKGWLNG